MQLTRTVTVTTTQQQTVQASCAACIYFDAPAKAQSGICRRNPPTGGWPDVALTDWCGEYEAKAS